MREQKANDNGFPVVGKQVKEQQIFPFDKLVEYDGAANKITINANVTINGDTNIGELDIDSGDAPKGQVLTADGDSGASWENRVAYLNLESESGNLTNAQIEVAKQDNVVIQLDGQFYYKNSQSDESIVFKAPAKVVDDDTIAEKVVIDLSDNTYSYSYEVVSAGSSFDPVYDDELNDSSTNAVQNKVIYEALEKKANVDGNYPTLTSGLADNLVATNGLITTKSFIMELTGGDQASAVSTGNMNLTLRGNSVVVNQLVKNGDFSDGTNNRAFGSSTSGSVSNNKATLTSNGTNTYVVIYQGTTPTLKSGRKYLITYDYDFSQSNEISNTSLTYTDNNQYISVGRTYVNKGTNVFILEPTLDNVVRLQFQFSGATNLTSGQYATITNVLVNDLTQWYGGNIPQDILDHPEKFINYYQGSLAYDTGHIENAQSTSLISRGINQWDEEWENGTFTAGGGKSPASNAIRNKTPIRVIPNTTYYIKSAGACFFWGYDINGNFVKRLPSDDGIYNTTLQIPSNVAYINFCRWVSTYNNDICINISNPDINGNYYKSEVNETPLGNDVLRSAGSVYDSKAPDGTITRRIGVVDLGTLTYTYTSGGQGRFVGTVPNIKVPSANNIPANILCARFTSGSASDVYGGIAGISCNANGDLWIYAPEYNGNTTAFKSAMDGVILYYELAEYTTEQGTPFNENIKVVKGGTLEFVGNGIPQGNSMFFQKNLKSFLEAFGTAINYDPSRIERLANLSFTPETADIVLNPSPANAYAKVQVMSSTFTIVVSAALTGTASGTITFQDSEVDLTNFETQPAKAIYDMDGKKVSEAPTTTDCNIASFVGRSYNGVILWSILHSGVNKIKIHFEQAIPLDENGNGKVDCRASLIL